MSANMTQDIFIADSNREKRDYLEYKEYLTKEEFNTISDEELENEQDKLKLKINICNCFKVEIFKPLITLKLLLFFWYGSGSFIQAFMLPYFQQRGISIAEFSTALGITPAVQLIGSLVFTLIADKLGRAKPILILTIALTMLFAGILIFIPDLSEGNCRSQPTNFKCHPKQLENFIAKTTCDMVKDEIQVHSCSVQCPDNLTENCHGRNFTCDILAGQEEAVKNFSWPFHIDMSYRSGDRCFYNVSSTTHRNSTFSWCGVPQMTSCRVACLVESGMKCSDYIENRDMWMVASMAIYVLFSTTFSSTYRFFDVTAMSLMNEHNADFGQQRLFCLLGFVLISPIGGAIVDASTPEGEPTRYVISLYVYLALMCVVIILTCWYEVGLKPPGKNMSGKTIKLLKNIDVLTFAVVLFALGTIWTFLTVFQSLWVANLKGPGILISLIPAIGALYGLPFLATSGWWVKKLGPNTIFIFAFLGYGVNTLGYSFLKDPWISLVLEMTCIFTYHLLWVAVVVKSDGIAPEGLKATVIGFSGSIHYHLGKLAGSSIGGFILSNFGFRTTFRIIAIIGTICACLYAFYIYIRKSCFTVVVDVQPSDENISREDRPISLQDEAFHRILEEKPHDMPEE